MSRKFLAPILIGLVGAAILVWLGIWQVQRLSWKEGILTEIDTRIAAQPVQLPDEPNFDEHRYLPVSLRGSVDGGLRVLISLKREGAGYRVISRLNTDAGPILLDRGFAKDVPAIVPPLGKVEVVGNLHWPDDLNSSTPEPDIAGNIWFARDLTAMAETLGTLPILVVARKMSPADTNLTPLPLDSATIPNDHLEYAITWFSLAIIWVAMTIFLLWRIRRRAF